MSNLQREKTPLKLGMEMEKEKRGGKLEGGEEKGEEDKCLQCPPPTTVTRTQLTVQEKYVFEQQWVMQSIAA